MRGLEIAAPAVGMSSECGLDSVGSVGRAGELWRDTFARRCSVSRNRASSSCSCCCPVVTVDFFCSIVLDSSSTSPKPNMESRSAAKVWAMVDSGRALGGGRIGSSAAMFERCDCAMVRGGTGWYAMVGAVLGLSQLRPAARWDTRGVYQTKENGSSSSVVMSGSRNRNRNRSGSRSRSRGRSRGSGRGSNGRRSRRSGRRGLEV